MKTLIIFFAAILFLHYPLSGQIESQYNNKMNQKGDFNIEYLNFASVEKGKTRLDIFFQVPYTEISFIKSGAGFKGSYTGIIGIYDENKEKLIVEKSWTENLEERDFEKTNSRNNYNLSLKSFDLSPGKYLIRTAIEDNESRSTVADEKIIVVKDLSSDISVSDIMLISKMTNVNGNRKILPNINRNVSTQKDSMPIFYEIYSDENNNFEITYSIKDQKEDEVVAEKNVTSKLDSGKNQIFYSFDDVDLSLGDFLLTVSVKEGENVLASNEKHFFSRWIGLPSTVKDLDKAIDQMVYIASSSEMDDIKDAETEEEKIQLYQDYWKKKDPTPQTDENPIFEEYYRRVTFANENFSHYQEGWKTDRGMVFILLGSPNNVDRHPFDYNSKPYEVWEYYNLNKSFVFLDETGFGDYRLITPLYGDLYRFR